MATYDFPQDLRGAQLRLHETQAEYEALGRTLPWSVEPSDGWTAPKVLYADAQVRDLPPSPGYTEEQKAEVARLRAEILKLSIAVSTHPYWGTVPAGDRVDQRMALKHVHEQDADASQAEAA